MDTETPHQYDYMNYGILTAFLNMLRAADDFPISPEQKELDEWLRLYEVMHAALKKMPMLHRHSIEARRHLLEYLDLKRSYVAAAMGAKRGRRDVIRKEMDEHLAALNDHFEQLAVRLGFRQPSPPTETESRA